jgi:predicted short-subunit dehydrogenase-like oxidoreductase (DUF2520 family)
MLKLNIIGAGRAGGTVACALAKTGLVQIGQVLNRTFASARSAVAVLGEGEAIDQLSDFSSPDAWLISTPDGEIESSVKSLVIDGPPLTGQAVLHLSGRFGPEILDGAGKVGAEVAAVHPVRSMPRLSSDVSRFRGTLCIAEGTPVALDKLRDPFTAAGAGWEEVQNLNRGLYHAALAIVSNVTKGVVWKAQKWLEDAGLNAEIAAEASHSLLSITVEDVFRDGARQSITGPVVRGDTSTVEAHLESLRKLGRHDADVYRVLARTVLDLANERGDLDDAVLSRFDELFGIRDS